MLAKLLGDTEAADESLLRDAMLVKVHIEPRLSPETRVRERSRTFRKVATSTMLKELPP